MNIKYLKGIILEQIARAKYLIKIIPPVNKECLINLKNRCKEKILNYLQVLSLLYEELENREEYDYRDVYRTLRIMILQIQWLEYFGISALYHQTDELDFINDLLPNIFNQINLNLEPPAIAFISTNYFSYSPITNVIFIPIGETNSILHLVDLYHEIGHSILNEIENLSIENTKQAYYQAVDLVNDYYANLLLQKNRETGPKDINAIINKIYSHWKDWIAEFFCDIFACCIIGSPYAWCHYHMCSKSSNDIYSLHQKHPSDDARMKILIECLNILNFKDDAKEISSFWKKIPLASISEPQFYQIYAYDKQLFKDLIEILYKGFQKDKILTISPEGLKNLDKDNIIKILNKSWSRFINDPINFINWEKDKIVKLKNSLNIYPT